MIITPQIMDKPNCTIKVKGQPIDIVKKKNKLGVIVDDELKVEDHIV